MRNFRDAAITLVAMLLLVFILEAGMRAAGVNFEASAYEVDPVLYTAYRPNSSGWEVKEGENFFQINSAGMRDRERQLQANPSTMRIAVVGDSMLASLQVPLDRTVPQILERRLDADAAKNGKHVEVLNFALGGATIGQMYLIAKERIWKFSPEVVLFCVSSPTLPSARRSLNTLGPSPYFLVSDGHPVPDPSNRPPEGSDERSRSRHRILGDLHNRIRLFQLVRAGLQSPWKEQLLKPFRSAKPSQEEGANVRLPFVAPANREAAEAWTVTEALITDTAREARSRGAEFWLVFVDDAIVEDPRPDVRRAFLEHHGISNFDYAAARYASLADRHGFPFFRTGPSLRQVSGTAGAPLRGFFNSRPFVGHWNERGAEAVAQLFEEQLRSRSAILKKWMHPEEYAPVRVAQQR